jgi:hypothetical protein
MALIIKIAQFFAHISDALDEAMEARRAAHQKYPFVPEE